MQHTATCLTLGPASANVCLLQAAEYTAIREELYFLRPLKAKVAGVLFWLAILLWFQVSKQQRT
jgi:hypothetical protein